MEIIKGVAIATAATFLFFAACAAAIFLVWGLITLLIFLWGLGFLGQIGAAAIVAVVFGVITIRIA